MAPKGVKESKAATPVAEKSPAVEEEAAPAQLALVKAEEAEDMDLITMLNWLSQEEQLASVKAKEEEDIAFIWIENWLNQSLEEQLVEVEEKLPTKEPSEPKLYPDIGISCTTMGIMISFVNDMSEGTKEVTWDEPKLLQNVKKANP